MKRKVEPIIDKPRDKYWRQIFTIAKKTRNETGDNSRVASPQAKKDTRPKQLLPNPAHT